MSGRLEGVRMEVLSDGVVTLRPFDPTDRPAIVAGRDAVFHRFMGEGSPEPAPMACITVARPGGEIIVGWIDADDERSWLDEREVNVGYSLSPEHRGHGYAVRALVLLHTWLASQSPPIEPTLLIDPGNVASIAVARRAAFDHVDTIGDQQLFRSAR